MLHKFIVIVLCISFTSACSSWVYRINIPQGNFLDKQGVEKLQLGMTKEQVKFVLGTPVVQDSFNDDTWYYVYRLKSGVSTKFDISKSFTVKFTDGKLAEAFGDFELPETFYTPIEN